MKKSSLTGNTVIDFSTINDVKTYIKRNENVFGNRYASHNNSSWNGTKTWEEFEKGILEKGNPSLLKEIKKKVNKRVDELEQKLTEKSMYNFDVVGDFFDIGTFMSGEPEHWLKEIKIKDEKFIHIKIGGVYPSGVDAQTIQKNASKIIALMRIMEGKGFLTKIDICFNSEHMEERGGKENLLITIPLKDYNQPLDYKKVSILLDTSFFRRAIFRVYELTYPKDLSSSYGRVKKVKDYINLANYNEVNSLEQSLLEKDK